MKHYLLASDFDQTLSFNDSGIALSELLGISGFKHKVAGLSRLNLVQQGGELAYLLRHDPEYRCVRRQDLAEVGRRVRLKRNIPLLTRLLENGIEGHRFDFYVISAAPEEVVNAALEGIVPPEHVIGTRLDLARVRLVLESRADHVFGRDDPLERGVHHLFGGSSRPNT